MLASFAFTIERQGMDRGVSRRVLVRKVLDLIRSCLLRTVLEKLAQFFNRLSDLGSTQGHSISSEDLDDQS